MEARIYSVNEDNYREDETRGLGRKKAGKEPKVKVTASKFDVDASPDGLEICVYEKVTSGTGERGGTPIKTIRRFVLRMNAKEVHVLLEKIFKNGHLSIPTTSRETEA